MIDQRFEENPELFEEEFVGEPIAKPTKKQMDGEKKTKAQRNKESRKRAAERELEEQAELKRRRLDLERIRSIKKQVDKELAQSEETHEKLVRRRAVREKFGVKRLGRGRFEAPILDYAMPEEIQSNLRTLKVDANLIQDRFASFQERNMIAPKGRARFVCVCVCVWIITNDCFGLFFFWQTLQTSWQAPL